MPKLYYIIGIAIFVIYLLISIIIISDYGITTDSPVYFTAGKTYFNYFIGLNKEFNSIRPIFHPPVAATLSHVTYIIFCKWLNLFSEISAHNLISVFLASLTILIVYFFTLQAYGFKTALFGTLFLALFPHFFGHAHNNLIDIPAAAFITLSIWSFWKLIMRKRWYWIIISGFLLAIAINTKLNAIFIIPILTLWLLIAFRHNISYDRINKKLTISPFHLSLLFFPIICIISIILTNPKLWHSPIENFLRIILDYSGWKGPPVFYFGKGYWPVDLPSTYATIYLMISTPLVILSFSILGLIISIKHTLTSTNKTSPLLIIWLGMCLLRYFIPGVLIWDGMRHILDAIPVFCIIAGIGASNMSEFLVRKLRQIHFRKFAADLVTVIFTICTFSPLIILNIQFHPFQANFFNMLVGGLKGAAGKFDLEYWYAANKQGIKWLNRYAKKNARIHIPFGDHLAHYYLRPDLELVHGGEDYILFARREGYYSQNSVFFNAPICYYLNILKPIHTIDVKGTPLLYIFDIAPLQKGFLHDAYFLGEFHHSVNKPELSDEEMISHSKPESINAETIISGRKVTSIHTDIPFFTSKNLGYSINGSVNYIYFMVNSPQAQLVDIKVSKCSEFEIWSNGINIFNNNEICTLRTDNFTISKINLNKGLNGFLVKFIPHSENFGFGIRFMKHSKNKHPGYTPPELLTDIEYKL